MTRFGLILAVAASLASAGALGAQTNSLTQRTLSLAEAIEMALQNNFALRIERHNIEQARFELRRSQTVYDPQLSFGLRRDHNSGLGLVDPDNNSLGLLQDSSQNDSDTLSYGVGGLGPMGFEYNLPVRFTRQLDGISDTTFNLNTFQNERHYSDVYDATFSIEMRQPLLRNFAVDGPRYTIQANKKLLQMSEHVFEGVLIEVVSLVQQTYYELIFTREYVKVQEQALKLSERLLDENRKRFNAGSMPILEVNRAEAEAATAKAALLIARQAVTIQENILKNLITKDIPEWKGVELMPSEQLLAIPQVVDERESWRTGLSKRPDLAQLRVDLERQDLAIKYRKNQTLPDVHLIGSYGHDALRTGAEDAFTDLHFRQKAVDYYYGVEVSFPWGRREAKLRLAQEKDQRFQKELLLQQLQQNIMVQIDDAVQAVRTSFDRITATRQAAEFALKVLQAEESRERVGVSTSFMLLQYQRDLTDARSQEIRAITAYNKALAQLMQAEGTTLERLKVQVNFK